jgi:predicted site-specific integrase-resolvase
MEREKHSIYDTARLLGVHRGTLRRWIKRGVIPEPIAEDVAGSRLRYWTAAGFAKVKHYKEEHFREGQGRRSKKVKKGK